MRLALLGLPVLVALGSASGGGPVQTTFAYGRETIAGIPGADSAATGRRIPTTYLIYVLVRKGTVPTTASVWLKGKYYGATLRRVSSPVVIDHDPAVPTGKRDTLVPATSSTVYQVHPAEEEAWSPKDDTERHLTSSNEVVVFLRTKDAVSYGSVKRIGALTPRAAP